MGHPYSMISDPPFLKILAGFSVSTVVNGQQYGDRLLTRKDIQKLFKPEIARQTALNYVAWLKAFGCIAEMPEPKVRQAYNSRQKIRPREKLYCIVPEKYRDSMPGSLWGLKDFLMFGCSIGQHGKCLPSASDTITN